MSVAEEGILCTKNKKQFLLLCLCIVVKVSLVFNIMALIKVAVWAITVFFYIYKQIIPSVRKKCDDDSKALSLAHYVMTNSVIDYNSDFQQRKVFDSKLNVLCVNYRHPTGSIMH